MPTKFNINIIRGSRYRKSFIYRDPTKTPINLSGFSARMQIRERDNSATPEMELTTDNGRLSISPGDGQVNIVLSASETDSLTINTGVYDLEIYDDVDPDIVDTILEGLITVEDGITR